MIGFTRRVLCSVVCVALVGGVPVLATGLEMLRQEAKGLPMAPSLDAGRPGATSVLLASDGSPIGRFAEQNRTPVKLADIPQVVQQAFVSAEDRSFWLHQGIDPFAIARAMLSNLRSRGSGKRPVGASTITQQLVKNLMTGDERSIRRKVHEAILAIRLERTIGKKGILEAYLNDIYLGNGAYGVAAAAETYFGKPLASLDLAESALLAAMPKGPANYDPVRRSEAALARRSYVLGRMVDDGAVSRAQADEARMEPLPRPSVSTMGGAAEGYFAEEARREVIAALGASALYKGGLTVRTSMDPTLQDIAGRVLRDGLCDYDRRHGWRGAVAALPPGTVLTDPSSWKSALQSVEPPAGAEDWRQAVALGFDRSGSAIVGFSDGNTAELGMDGMRWARRTTASGGLGPVPRSARDVMRPGDVILVSPGVSGRLELRQMPEVEGALVAVDVRTGRVLAIAGGFSYERSPFNRAVQSVRQPGSAFKPFIYLTAFEKGWDATSPVLDSPIALDPGGGAPRWRPSADGGSGWGLITARRSLENSRNLASVRLLYDLGLDAVGDTARRFGLYPSLPFAAALGALDISDLRLTAGYAMLANGGYKVNPTLIDRVDGPGGAVIAKRAETTHDRVADPVAVAQLTSVLEGVVRHGTAAQSLSKIALPIAGKTGTSNGPVDAWFVGYTPDITVGVHVGFDQPADLGSDEFGGRAAAPIFGAFVQAAARVHPPSSATFPLPPGAVVRKVDPATGDVSKTGTDEVFRAD